MTRHIGLTAVVWALCAGGFVSGGDAADSPTPWPQWRGAARDGVSAGLEWPDDLGGLGLVWRVELGRGYPGPIVAADRVFVVESAEDESAGVRALDRSSGRVLWQRRWSSRGDVPFFAASNGDWVRSTPAFDGNTLYVGDMREVLVALDGATGEERWRVDLPARFDRPVPDFGFASSPLVDSDHLYVQAADSLVKLDKRTGATIWRTLEQGSGMTSSGAFSSPILATLAGVRQVVVQTREALHGVDPDSGRVLWSQPVPNFRGMNILTPVVVGDAIFTSPYRHGSFRYDVARADDAWTVTTAWSNKASGYMSTPIVADGHLFLHLGNERLDCLNLATGESRWRSEPVGKYWSMVRRGDKILALSERGILHLLRADPGLFRPLASRKVADQETWGHLAASGDELFVRELRAISAWRWNSAPSPEPGARETAPNQGHLPPGKLLRSAAVEKPSVPSRPPAASAVTK